MLKIGVVGDLSQCDPANLAKALDAAMGMATVTVQVGDINPGYDVLKARMTSGTLHPVPGNHDNPACGPGNWDVNLPGVPKQWRLDFPEAVLIGLDNSVDALGPGWDILNQFDVDAKADPSLLQRPLFVFTHKSPTPLVLPDGTESTHIMGEGSPCPEADKLRDWLKVHDATLVCGHYHGCSLQNTVHGPILLEGRGGASRADGQGNKPGYTLILANRDGWVAHALDA